MERAKKNFESGAVFQADDEKLIPSLLQYINEQVNTNVNRVSLLLLLYIQGEEIFRNSINRDFRIMVLQENLMKL